VFAGQAEQLRFAILEQLDAPANENMSPTHFEQFVRLTAPEMFEEVPAGHLVQTLAVVTPVRFEKVPGPHRHVEIVFVFVSNALNVFAGHDTHDDDAE
jgi:hypothetical protein